MSHARETTLFIDFLKNQSVMLLGIFLSHCGLSLQIRGGYGVSENNILICLLMSTHNICFYGQIRKISTNLV